MRPWHFALCGLVLVGTFAYAQEPVKLEMPEVFDHQIGSRRVIHSSGYSLTSGPEDIALQVIVDAAGNVESVKAIQGPAEFFGQAESLEAKRKFKPFLRDGNPVRVAFLDYVSIMPLEQWAETKVPFPEIKDWSTLKMRLERTECYGSCPAYSVEVKGDGAVDFTGTFNVLVMGHHRGRISKQALEALLAAFRQANYFSLRESYAWPATDLPTYKTSIEFDGHKKSVHDYAGLEVGMPEAAQDVEESVDRIAGTEKWIKGNEETGAALVAEKWDFKADTDENRVLFANAINHGPADLVQLFVRNGAPALSMTKEGQGALVSAARKGDLDLVKRMLASQSNPSAALLSCALGAAARSGNLELTQFLIEKGADVNGPACGKFLKTTVLMNAAESGKAEIVEEILAYHPDVDAAMEQTGLTALAYFLRSAGTQIDTEKIVKLLVAAGANIDSRDSQGDTPVFYACQNQHPEAIRILAAAGADLNAKDRNGQTTLMSCSGNGALKAMIDAGADLTLKNSSGRTAAEEARQMGALDKAELLEAVRKQRSPLPH